VDVVGWVQMTIFPIRQVLPVGLGFAAGLGFPEKIMHYSRYNIFK